jgi:D-glycero-alpha-D-manno-heptose-7-phosphate kinase
VGAELEAQTIRVPTGKQDYYAATYGGVNSIWFGVGENRVERLLVQESDLAALESRLILSFTGEPHYSAITNWGMLKGYVEGQERAVGGLRRIKETAWRMRECLRAGAGAGAAGSSGVSAAAGARSFPTAVSGPAPGSASGSPAANGAHVPVPFPGLAELVAEEWRNRRELADGVTTPNVDRIMAAAEAAGAKASKLCGAGGGGCMITVIGDDSDAAVRARVEATLTAAGARIIPFKIARTGVRVEVRTDDADGVAWLTTDPVGAGLLWPVTVAGVEAAATEEDTVIDSDAPNAGVV